MSANDLLTLLTRLIFVLLGIVTIYNYARYKDTTRRDIALLFGALAIIFVTPLLFPDRPNQPNPIGQVLSWIAEVALPLLLLRLLRYFRPVPPRLLRLAWISMIASWVVLILQSALPKTLLNIIVIVIVLYFALSFGYAMVAFVRGAVTTYGVVRQRLRFAAAGAGLLAGVFLCLIAAALFTSLLEILTPVVLLIAASSALCFYVGFAPPHWIQSAWQANELRAFLMQVGHKSSGESLSIDETFKELSVSANRAVGGMVSAIAQPGAGENSWNLRYLSNDAESVNAKLDWNPIFRQNWQDRKPRFVRVSKTLNTGEHDLLQTFDADTLLLTPIEAAEHMRGILLVFLKYGSLFAEDDLDLVTLMAQQSAIFLENRRLVEELHQHSEQLEKSVEERTSELQESQKQYRRIVETAQEGIWLSDRENKVLFVNPRMAEMLGYTVEEMSGESGYKFLDAENAALSRSKRVGRNNGVKEQYELHFRHRDNRELIMLVSATPLTDDDGTVLGSLAMLVDITERKRAEEEIRQLNAELEQRVADRTAQLSAVNKELESFSYSVSHDLRAPLRAMDGFSQALLEDYGDKLDDDGRFSLQRIRAASQRMGQLIDALLQLSRLSRSEIQIEQVNLSELVRAIEVDLREEFPERQVQMVIADGVVVKGDERLLRAALSNLLRNAWKFTSKKPEPRVEFGTMEQDGHPVYYVRDNGAGFDMTYANKLFGAFQRLHAATEFEGTGIGLATVERIIHRHNGHIWAEAVVNEGATFYFSFNGASDNAREGLKPSPTT